MFDPREEKLPKWTQELLHQERLKSALRFPDTPAPTPDFTTQQHGGFVGQKPQEGTELFSSNSDQIFRHFVGVNGYLHSNERLSGFGARASGSYYLCLQDARLARRWMVARRCAEKMLSAETATPLT